jgi:hypothetical protein
MDLGALMGGGGGGGGGKTASASSTSGVNVSYGTDLATLLPWLIGGAVALGFLGLLWLLKRK